MSNDSKSPRFETLQIHAGRIAGGRGMNLSFKLPFPLILEGGGVIEDVTVAYRTWGRLDASGTNAVLVCHALTGNADDHEWWEPLIGPGRALDPSRDFIVCSNILGSGYGTTGPSTSGPDFPRITVRDIVAVQRSLVRHLGIRRLRLVIGGSFGGMQALEWAWAAPDLVESLAVIAASGPHDIARGRGPYENVLASIRQRALIVSIDSDVLHPPSEQEELAMLMPNATLHTIASPHGHEGFLIDAAAVNDAVLEWQRTPRARTRIEVYPQKISNTNW
jgi:homoserine acetyltransferase